jgi:protein-disulfide isomerase
MPVGSTKAKVVVDVYEDFMCPFCGQFEAASRSYVDKTAGAQVLFRYHIIAFLDRASSTEYSSRASNALAVVLDAAGPEVAKKFHDELYARQPQEGSPGLSDTELVKLAVAAGATQSDVEKPIKDREFAGWVRNATDAASKAGVNQTPTVLVDGQPVGGQTIDEIVVTMQSMIQRSVGQ